MDSKKDHCTYVKARLTPYQGAITIGEIDQSSIGAARKIHSVIPRFRHCHGFDTSQDVGRRRKAG